MSDGLRFLSAILDTGSARELRHLQTDLFVEAERPVFEYIKRHYRQFGELPTVDVVRRETRTELPTINQAFRYYKQKLFDRKTYNLVRDAFPTLRGHMQSNDMSAVVQEIARLNVVVRAGTPREDLRSLQESIPRMLQDYQYRHDNPGVSGIPSGFPSFDEHTGGYQPHDLVAYVARMGTGKTYNVLQQANSMWRAGKKVLFISMEMPIDQIMIRLGAINSGINPDFIKKGMLSTYAHRALVNAFDSMRATDRFLMYSGAFKSSVVDLEMLIQETQPEIVIIDGLYLVKPSVNVRGGRYERIAEAVDELSAMRIRCGVPFVMTTQFSRKAGKEGKDGDLEEIAFTDALAVNCTMVFSLKFGESPYKKTRRTVKILKDRDGSGNFSFTTHYRFAPVCFEEVDMHEQATATYDLDWMAT